MGGELHISKNVRHAWDDFGRKPILGHYIYCSE
jgi:hypothetical protein